MPKQKNIILFLVLVFFLNLSCSSSKKFITKSGLSSKELDKSYLAYSHALYFKNIFIEADKIYKRKRLSLRIHKNSFFPPGQVDFFSEKKKDLGKKEKINEKNLQKAISLFKSSLKTEDSPEEIYNQLSECYFLADKLKDSINYAQKSIQFKKDYFTPYKRIFHIYSKLKEKDKAIKVLESYLKIKPKDFSANYLLACYLINNKVNFEKGEKYFKKIITTPYQNRRELKYQEKANFELGNLAYNNNNIHKAIKFYQQTYEINNSNYEAVYKLANLYSVNNQLAKSLEMAKTFLTAYPNNSEIMILIGKIKYLRHDPKAIDYLCYTKNSKSKDLLAQALYYELQDENLKAKTIFKSLTSEEKNSLLFYLARAKINLKENNKKEAYRLFFSTALLALKTKNYQCASASLEKAINLYPDKEKGYFYLGYTKEQLKDYDQAINNYKIFYQLSKNDSIFLTIGVVYAFNKDYFNSFNYFDKFAKNNSKSGYPDFYKGLIYLWDKKYLKATNYFAKAISIDKTDPDFYYYMAVANKKLGKNNLALKNIKKAFEMASYSPKISNFLGYLYAEMGINLNEALNLIQSSLRNNPNNPAYLDSLGYVYYQQKKFKKALKYFVEAENILIQNKPDSGLAQVYNHLGDTYKELGQLEKATFFWLKSLFIEKNKNIEAKVKNISKSKNS